jgi:predicted outer membrane repeat protein
MKRVMLVVMLGAAIGIPTGCGDDDSEADEDAGPDGATDTDTDVDTDTDADTDTDTDTDDECVRYVDVDVSLSGDGLSWATAFATVQEGIDAAYAEVELLGSCQVWVADGVYTIFESAPEDTLQLMFGVQVYGGFDGTETLLEERDFVANITVLHGTSEAYHVVTGAEEAILDGFTVTGGNALDASDPDNPFIPNNNGGGMYVNDCTMTIANCTFSANFALRGGGLYLGYSQSTVDDCSFEGNDADDGGGAYVLNYSPELTGCVFEGNGATFGGGGLVTDDTAMQLTDCVFELNAAEEGGAIKTAGSDQTSLEYCTFVDNTAYNGGAVMGTECTLSSSGMVASGNSAAGDGGAIMLGAGGTALFNTAVFSGNHANGFGGAIRATGENSLFDIRRATFFGNTTGLASGGALSVGNNTVATVVNSVLWGDLPDEVGPVAGALEVDYCDVQGGYGGAGNIDADPLFVDTDLGDLHLSAGSPCIDAADGFWDSSDIEGNPAVDDPDTPNTGIGDPPYTDIGAYEYQP